MTQTVLPAIQELQSKRQWVVYCLEPETDKDGNTRLTKVPYQARTGYKASSTNPKHWSTYEQAVKVCKNLRNADGKPFDGIGFVFNRDVTGVDCDHCIDDQGNIDPWAQEIIDTLSSYTERSPNDGIHIIGRGLVPLNEKGKHAGRKITLSGKRHPQAAVEMYSEGRFFTVTEKHLADTPTTLEDFEEQLHALHAKIYAPKPPTPKQKPIPLKAPADIADDNTLLDIATAARNGAKFSALFFRGDTSAYGGDESAADQALCNYLAFYTGRDASRMDRLFRRSALYRDEKWDRNARSGETYGEGTIARAIEGCIDVYTPGYGRIEEGSNGHKPTTDKERSTLPQFIIEGQLREQEEKALAVLAKANKHNPHLFMYLSTVSKVEKDEMGRPLIMQLDRAGIRHELSCAADFFAWKKKGDTYELVDTHPSKDLADQLLALSPGQWPLRPLKALVEAPVLRPDGSILDQSGYDERTNLYYVPGPGMERCKIPNHPMQADAKAALDFLRPMFGDFPFESDADRANTFALLFTPFVRHAVKKDIQMALVDATNPGTGKGLITTIVSIVATGQHTSPMTAKKDDDEWRKAILTELLSGPRIVILDNIRGVLESQALELILTSEGFNERILGQSKSAKPKNEATWMATGNNLLIGGDLPRRCYRIRLIAEQANPDERPDESFAIPDLEDWTYEHRPEIVAAILTIARAWYLAGKPKPTNVPNLGTFSDWAKTVGGMLEYAGMEGFQQNRAELRSRNNEEAQEWEAFLSSWFNVFPNEWKGASEMAKKISEKNEHLIQPPANPLFDTLPQYLKKALADKPNSFEVTLAIQLGKRVQTVYGSERYRIEKDLNTHTKTNVWRVMRGVAGGSPIPTQGQKLLSSLPSCDESIAHNSERGTIPLQPPATDDAEKKTPFPQEAQGVLASQLSNNGDIVAQTDVAGGSQKNSTDTRPYIVEHECYTVIESKVRGRERDHGKQVASIQDDSGNWWCENCIYQHDLMNLACLRNYTELTFEHEGKSYTIAGTKREYMKFAQSAGYSAVKAALNTLEKEV